MGTSIHITPPPLSKQSMDDLLSTIMVFCKANDERGEPFWSYLCLKPSMAESFKQARDSGKMDLQEYGTIIEWGRGESAPQEVKERMERDFGVDHNYEDKLIKAIKENRNKL